MRGRLVYDQRNVATRRLTVDTHIVSAGKVCDLSILHAAVIFL